MSNPATQTVTTFPRRGRVGVNRDGQPVGHATRVSRKGQPEQWSAFVYLKHAPFDTVRPGFGSEAEAVAFIAENGVTPNYMDAR